MCDHEKTFSTQPTSSGKKPRISETYGHKGRTQSVEPAPGQRKNPTGRLIHCQRSESLSSGVSESLRFFLKKNQRILKRFEFVSISESGHRFYSDFFIALAMPAGSGCSRIGITVSRKVGGAVQRNRIKRLAREAFRLNRHLLARPLDINLIARKTAAEQSNRVILQALQDLFEKLPRQFEH